ncbi:histidine kinase [Gordoniibacillus kamchatkensis]|uniref:Histidine kinase n=2 Tax=Gordoniibacillus kamchatkensis TaxID=1590651 RepID=A0ABR5ABE2_9BACL|nr:HD-GYP domain-containing protein [Paenibacillus sp. VKM B-2647]KIL38212.1 histidine kinase [Paenibacillus sp. VKM B-2647]
MRLLPTTSCVSGMRLAKPIFNEEGVILLGRHVELSQSLINRLQQLGVDYLYIEDPDTEDVEVEDVLSDETKRRALTEIRTHFGLFMEATAKKKFSRAPTLGKTFGDLMKMIIDDISGHRGALIMLMNMNVLNTYVYQHSLNVSIYTVMLGMANGFNREELMVIGLGSLLHDIGKTKINWQLLQRPGPLSPDEYEEIKKHTEYGYKMLKDEPNMPLIAAHCAFQHHERIDGSGYPRGIKGGEIHDYAKWIAIADSYDAMTTHRSFRRAMLPHQAMEILFTGAGTLYDTKKIAFFRDNVAIYPIGVTVKLNTGVKGVVTDINPSAPQRPVVRVLTDEHNRRISQPYEVDLTKQLTVMIDQVELA